MDTSVELTRDTLPFILTLLLGWLFLNLSKTGDATDVSNKTKLNVAVAAGIFLGIVLMLYEAKAKDILIIIRDYRSWVKYILLGFIVGTSAIGMNQLQRGFKKNGAGNGGTAPPTKP